MTNLCPFPQIPLKALVQLHLGAIADKQLPPDLMRLKTLGLSLLGAPRTDPNRWTQAEARRSTRPPEGIEGVFELAIGRISAVYKVSMVWEEREPTQFINGVLVLLSTLTSPTFDRHTTKPLHPSCTLMRAHENRSARPSTPRLKRPTISPRTGRPLSEANTRPTRLPWVPSAAARAWRTDWGICQRER